MFYFRADGNENIGVGHLMRCSAIAAELIRSGYDVLFVISPDSNDSILTDNNFAYHRLKVENELGWSSEEFCNWLSKQTDPDPIVILDSYRVNYLVMESIRKIAKLIYIDDLVAFDYPVDAIINFNIEANEKMYSSPRKKNRKIFLGTKYFPCREEFKMFKKDDVKGRIEKVLLTCSSTDPVDAIYSILMSINPSEYKHISFNVILGKYFSDEYSNKLRALCDVYKNVTLLPWGQNMAQLLYDHDLLIAPGSTVMLESFIVGTPCISFYFVDNQITPCQYAEAENMAFSIGNITDSNHQSMINELMMKIQDYSVRKAQFDKYSKAFDNRGCSRIRNILEEI